MTVGFWFAHPGLTTSLRIPPSRFGVRAASEEGFVDGNSEEH